MPEKGRGFARRVTPENLGQFAPLLRRQGGLDGHSQEVEEAQEPATADPALLAALTMFEGESIRTAAPRPQGRSTPAEIGAPRDAAGTEAGAVVWRKRLVASDVQSQTGNATGGVRLTQAGYTIPGEGRIDQTTYFRNSIFADLTWSVGRRRPYREDAWGTFRIRVRGEDWGLHRLRVSHKPSGEAGQHNYTTILHWGDLGARIRDARLTGAVLVLHQPLQEGEPHLIEVA